MESATAALESRLQWSRTRYSLRDFISMQQQRMDTLPAIVRVAEGYTGDDDDDQSHNVNEGAVLFVYCVDHQARVIVQTEDDRFVSFARSCPLLFHVVLNDQSLGGACVLGEIVERERNNVGDLRIRMAEPENEGLGPKDAGYEDVRGVLTVLDLFDEKYLLCHPLSGDVFRCAEVVSIASYLPLSVVVARGWKMAAEKSHFRDFLLDVRASGQTAQRRYSEQPTRNSEEIVVFSDLPNGDYELIVPSSSSSSLSSSSVEMSRIPSFKVFDKKKPKTSPDDSSGSEVTVALVSPPPSSLPSLPPRKLSGGWTSVDNLTLASSSHPARRPLPPVPDEKAETGSGKPETGSGKPETGSGKPETGSGKPETGSGGPNAAKELPEKIRTKIGEEEEEEKKTKTMDRKEKKSAKNKNKKKNFFAFMKETGRYSPHSNKSSDEATAPEVIRENPVPVPVEKEVEEEERKGPRSYVRKRTKGIVDRRRIPERRADLIRFARELPAEDDEEMPLGVVSGSLTFRPEVTWTGSDRPTTLGISSSSSSSLEHQREFTRPLVTFSSRSNITANSASSSAAAAAAAAAKAVESGGRVKPPVAKKPSSSSSSFLPSATTTTTTTTTKTEGLSMDQPSKTLPSSSSSSSLAKKKTSTGRLPEPDLGDSGMFSSSFEHPHPLPPHSIQSSGGGGVGGRGEGGGGGELGVGARVGGVGGLQGLGGGGGGVGGGGGGEGRDLDDYESFYDVIQSPRGRTSVSSGPEEEEWSSGGGVYPETPDRDFSWDPMMSHHPQKKMMMMRSQQQQQQRRRMEEDNLSGSGPDQKKKNPLDSYEDDDDGSLDSSYEEIRLPPSSSPSSSTMKPTLTPPSSLEIGPLPGTNRHSWIPPPDSTACDLTISLHEDNDQTAPRPPSLITSSANHQQQNHLWESIDEIPGDISSLSVEQVSACLNVLNLGHYVRSFREQQIDGALLTCLDREVLVGDFRFRSFEAIKLVKFARDGWRPRLRRNEETNA